MQTVDSAFDPSYAPAPLLVPGLWDRRPPRPRPASPPDTVDGATLLTSHLAVVNSAIAIVARQNQLSLDEREELASLVYVRLLEKDSAILRQFRAESSLRTFLVVVIKRILIDAHIARNGKWRPSRRAQRIGAVAVELERLVYREGRALHDAAATLRNRFEICDTDDELAFLLSLLPRRTRRRFVGLEAIEHRASTDPAPDEAVLNPTGRRTMAALQESLAGLSARDRRILRLRFHEGRRLSDIARIEGVDPRWLYRRVERLLKNLRTNLLARGISDAAV